MLLLVVDMNSLLCRHVHYLGTIQCRVTWISMVRSPVDWIVSRFRFDFENVLPFIFNDMKVAGKVLSFFHPPRYDRRPSSSSRRYSELLATGIVEEPTEEEWRKKNLSACILAADPECLPTRGKVILDK